VVIVLHKVCQVLHCSALNYCIFRKYLERFWLVWLHHYNKTHSLLDYYSKRFVGSVRFLKDFKTFIQQGNIKSVELTFALLQNNSISSKCCSFDLPIHQIILKMFSTKILSSTNVYNIASYTKCFLSTKSY